MTQQPGRLPRRGYTLVELLVVIGIIGILMAMLLPAVQAARESARRMECKNNLKQIGLGLQAFHDAHEHFPAAHTQDLSNITPDNYGQPAPYDKEFYYSWLCRILPHIEQQNLYDQIRFDEYPFPAPAKDGGYINGRTVELYHCPSNPRKAPLVQDYPPEVGHAHTHYLGVNGTDQFSFDGMLYVNSRVVNSEGHIPDGTSHTLFVGERPPSHDGYAGWWVAGSGLYPWFGSPDVVVGTQERIAVNWVCTPNGEKSSYQKGVFRYVDDGYGWEKHGWHFWSGHPDGANFLFVDGSVRFVPYSIGQPVFRNLGTRAGGEVNNGEF